MDPLRTGCNVIANSKIYRSFFEWYLAIVRCVRAHPTMEYGIRRCTTSNLCISTFFNGKTARPNAAVGDPAESKNFLKDICLILNGVIVRRKFRPGSMKSMIKFHMCSQSKIARQNFSRVFMIVFPLRNLNEVTCYFCKHGSSKQALIIFLTRSIQGQRMRIQEGITPACPDVISVLNVCQPFDGTNLKSMDFSRERLRRVLRK